MVLIDRNIISFGMGYADVEGDNAVLKQEVGDLLITAYQHSLVEQLRLKEFGFFRVLKNGKTLAGFSLQGSNSIRQALSYLKDLGLPIESETAFQLFLMDSELICTQRQNKYGKALEG